MGIIISRIINSFFRNKEVKVSKRREIALRLLARDTFLPK